MGTVYNRGSRGKPNWYVAYKDADGERRAVPSKQSTKALARKYLAEIEARIAAGKVGIEEPTEEPRCEELMTQWAAGLVNRYAHGDRGRLRKHVLPVFGEMRIGKVNLARVMQWIDDQRAAGKLSSGSIRHNLNLLSRFFSWAIERGHASVNPVRQIPTGKRPQQAAKTDTPWLDDESMVRRLFAALETPIDLMFYIGNRSGLRTGEICGLRMSDLGFLDEGVIRVRFSYNGPLKEDKHGTGKVKWVPAAEDCETVLQSWLEQRRAAGAGPESLVFPSVTNPGKPPRAKYVDVRWKAAAKSMGVELNWYQATRHSFVSRNLAGGASLDEVSAAVGHSSPVVTKRYYDHYVRRSFSKQLRAGLSGLGHPKD